MCRTERVRSWDLLRRWRATCLESQLREHYRKDSKHAGNRTAPCLAGARTVPSGTPKHTAASAPFPSRDRFLDQCPSLGRDNSKLGEQGDNPASNSAFNSANVIGKQVLSLGLARRSTMGPNAPSLNGALIPRLRLSSPTAIVWISRNTSEIV